MTRHAEAACAELRQNIAEQSKQLRAKIAPADNDVAGAPSKKKKVNKAAAKPKAKGKSTRGSAAAPIAGSEGGDVDEGPPEVMAVDETEEEAAQEEEVGEEQEIGGTAKVSLSIKGGPYDGSVFEIFVEEDGDARLVGRSTGKKASPWFLSVSFECGSIDVGSVAERRRWPSVRCCWCVQEKSLRPTGKPEPESSWILCVEFHVVLLKWGRKAASEPESVPPLPPSVNPFRLEQHKLPARVHW